MLLKTVGFPVELHTDTTLVPRCIHSRVTLVEMFLEVLISDMVGVTQSAVLRTETDEFDATFEDIFPSIAKVKVGFRLLLLRLYLLLFSLLLLFNLE